MPCPFPGMDPYLELPPFWSDFAPTLLSEIRNHVLARLLPRYDVRIEEYLVLTEDDVRLHRLRRYLSVTTTPTWSPSASGGLAVMEPATTEMEYPEYEPHTQRRLKIIHQPTEKVVTVMELLSPGNKAPGEGGLDLYLEKRAELLSCGCNLVELDLLRGGQRLPMAGQWPAGDYFAFVGRVGRRRRCQVIGWPLRAPLPAIPIPLLAPDPELSLDLQTVFRGAYEPAFYDRRLPYDRPLQPPLAPEDEQWVREALTATSR
jgi:hypothetical protein